jgi:uncharacterized phage protein gp47/JayE
MAQLYIRLDQLLDNAFADTAPREFLERIALSRGIVPNEASNAIVRAEFTPSDITIENGTRFNCDDFNYVVMSPYTENDTAVSGQYLLMCETSGSEPNSVTGQLLPIDYISRLQTAEIIAIDVLGEDVEDTEDFRARYFSSLSQQASGGNVAWYLEEIRKISGVGECKVYRAWDGPGTVKLVITDSNYGVPTSTLINDVQTRMDPVPNSGDGIGIAPIGHYVTVTGVTADSLNIDTEITYESDDVTFEDVRTAAESAIDRYFNSLAEGWEDTDNIIVRISQIEMSLLSVTGIVDIGNTKINGTASNYTLESDSIPVRGDFNAAG